MLAAEYALGTLQGKARMRYLKLLLKYPKLRPCLWKWERFFELYALTSPVRPIPNKLKDKILSQIKK